MSMNSNPWTAEPGALYYDEPMPSTDGRTDYRGRKYPLAAATAEDGTVTFQYDAVQALKLSLAALDKGREDAADAIEDAREAEGPDEA